MYHSITPSACLSQPQPTPVSGLDGWSHLSAAQGKLETKIQETAPEKCFASLSCGWVLHQGQVRPWPKPSAPLVSTT